MSNEEKMAHIPVWEKLNLTFDEAALYTGVGVGKLRELAKQSGLNLTLRIGNKTMLKRKRLEEYLDNKEEI